MTPVRPETRIFDDDVLEDMHTHWDDTPACEAPGGCDKPAVARFTVLCRCPQSRTWDTSRIKTTPEDSSPGSFIDRVDDITAKILNWCDPREGDVIAMEGPSFGAKGAAVDRMFALFWFTYKAIREHHGDPWIVTPSTVKKLATGKGNAGKDEVLLATAHRIPESPASNNDESDATWLAVAASYYAGSPILLLPKTHTTGLMKGTK